MGFPFHVKIEFRAMTYRTRNRESSVMIATVTPSLKYSCSGSPDMLVKGNTAIEGWSGNSKDGAAPCGAGAGANAGAASGIAVGQPAASHSARNARTTR